MRSSFVDYGYFRNWTCWGSFRTQLGSQPTTTSIIPSILDGDNAEPYKLDIPEDDIRLKEAQVFDNATQMIVDRLEGRSIQ